MTIRPPAVAGSFYPATAPALWRTLQECFDAAVAPVDDATVPKAVIVPHAGLVYSGPVAASAYLRLARARGQIRRVVLLGPSHTVWLDGVALSSASRWSTPLGDITVDNGAHPRLADLPWVTVNDRAHAGEHSLEVQLPFLQAVLGDDFGLIPLVVGDASTDQVAAVLDRLWGGPETVIVVSTDLSHYHAYDDAVRLDSRTAAAIAAFDGDHIHDTDACGARGLRGLLSTCDQRHLRLEQLDLRNSGDTAGDRRKVVGYGAFALA